MKKYRKQETIWRKGNNETGEDDKETKKQQGRKSKGQGQGKSRINKEMKATDKANSQTVHVYKQASRDIFKWGMEE